MKKLLIFSVVLLCVVNLFAQTAEPGNEADTLNKHAVKLFQEGDYKQALSDAIRAVELYSKSPERDKVPAAVALTNLGYIYIKLEKTQNAKDAFAKAGYIYEGIEPLASAEAKKYASLLETAALVDAFDKDLTEAGEKLNKALQIREKVNGPNAAETAETLNKLAQIYRVSGDYEAALPLQMRSIEINARATSVSAEKIFTAMCMLDALGKETESKDLQKRFIAEKDADPNTLAIPLINGGLLNDEASSLPPPEYPRDVRSSHIDGPVDVRVLYDENGKTVIACAISGKPQLYNAAEAAAYKAVFRPAILGGKPMKVSGYLKYMFKY